MKKPTEPDPGDMPPDVSPLEGWRKAARVADPAVARPPARRITINLDSDIVAIFKAEALKGGPPYQVAINQALRAYLRDRESRTADQSVRTVLNALEDPRVRRRIRELISRGRSRR